MISPSRGDARGRSDLNRRRYHVEDVARLVEDEFRANFPTRMWVLGRVAGARHLDDGGWKLELRPLASEEPLALPVQISAGAASEMDEYLGRDADAAVADLLVDGYVVRAGGLLRYHFQEHRLVLEGSALDPGPTEEMIREIRGSNLDWARAERLGERQRSLAPALVPLRVGVVGDPGGPGTDRAVAVVRASPYGIGLRVYATRMSGSGAPERIAGALDQAAADGSDVVLLVREARGVLRLAPFDTEPVVRATVRCPVPVITGIGPGGEGTVADAVAYQAWGEPAKAASTVVARLSRAEALLASVVGDIDVARDEARQRAGNDFGEALAAVRYQLDGARLRANRSRARQRRLGWAIGVALALIVVVLALATGSPYWLFGLLPALAVVGMTEGREANLARGRRRAGGVYDGSFSEALDRLRHIAEELRRTSAPERVDGLAQEAEALAARCREILGVTPPAASSPTGARVVQPVPRAASGRTVTSAGSAPRAPAAADRPTGQPPRAGQDHDAGQTLVVPDRNTDPAAQPTAVLSADRPSSPTSERTAVRTDRPVASQPERPVADAGRGGDEDDPRTAAAEAGGGGSADEDPDRTVVVGPGPSSDEDPDRTVVVDSGRSGGEDPEQTLTMEGPARRGEDDRSEAGGPIDGRDQSAQRHS